MREALAHLRRQRAVGVVDLVDDRLDRGVDLRPGRERQLLEGLTQTDKRRLNDLLAKLIDSLRAEQAG